MHNNIIPQIQIVQPSLQLPQLSPSSPKNIYKAHPHLHSSSTRQQRNIYQKSKDVGEAEGRGLWDVDGNVANGVMEVVADSDAVVPEGWIGLRGVGW